jgi:type IV pilus assembly protein PilA
MVSLSCLSKEVFLLYFVLNMSKSLASKRGFTLIEILVVIGLIAILAAIVLIAINPARQFAQARNSQRESNLNTILNAIGQNLADNKGVFTCTGVGTAITTSTTTIGTASGNSNLGCLVPTYIPGSLPYDPVGTPADTDYEISVTSSGRYTICAVNHDEAAVPGSVEYCISR